MLAERQANVRTPNDIRVTRYREKPKPGGDDLLTPLASNTGITVNPDPQPTQTPAPVAPDTATGGGGAPGSNTP
jgi:hypothetical protein